jgi:hypothetical protein
MSKGQNAPQQGTGAIVVGLLRIIALVLLISGVIGLIVWGIDFRAPGVSGAARSDHILLGVGGTIFAAVMFAGVAFVADLLDFVRGMERAPVIRREEAHRSSTGR